MKKLLPLLLILLMFAVGCNGSKQPTQPTTSKQSITSVPDITVSSVSKSITPLKVLGSFTSLTPNGDVMFADSIDFPMPQDLSQAPIINNSSFSVSGAYHDFRSARIYTSTKTYTSYSSLDELCQALNTMQGEYVIGLEYLAKGEYLPSYDSHEIACYHYYFKVSI